MVVDEIFGGWLEAAPKVAFLEKSLVISKRGRLSCSAHSAIKQEPLSEAEGRTRILRGPFWNLPFGSLFRFKAAACLF